MTETVRSLNLARILPKTIPQFQNSRPARIPPRCFNRTSSRGWETGHFLNSCSPSLSPALVVVDEMPEGQEIKSPEQYPTCRGETKRPTLVPRQRGRSRSRAFSSASRTSLSVSSSLIAVAARFAGRTKVSVPPTATPPGRMQKTEISRLVSGGVMSAMT